MSSDAFRSEMEWLGLALLGWHLLAFILCGMGLGLIRILRREGPTLRTHILRATLVGILFLPGFALINFSEGRAGDKSTEISTTEATGPFIPWEWQKVAVWRPVLTQMSTDTGDQGTDPSSPISWKLFLTGLSTLCLVLGGVGLFRLGMGMTLTARWIALARPCGERDRRSCEKMAETMGINAPRVLLSDQIRSPMVTGIFRPVLLLPEGLTVRNEVWKHELTHLRHGDIFWNLLVTGLTFCFPLQLLFSFLKRAMTEAAEERCDDAVLIQGGDPQSYAGLLVDLAEKEGGRDICSLPMARSSMLERRLARFLDASWLSRSNSSGRIRLTALGVLVLGICFAGWVYSDMRRSTALANAGKTETKEYSFSVYPITGYWQQKGFSQRLVALDDKADETAWGFRILSNKVAAYLESLSEKKVKVTVQQADGNAVKVIRVGELDLSKLSPGELEMQAAVRATGHVVPGYGEFSTQPDDAGQSYDGTLKLEVAPSPPPVIAAESSGKGLKLRTDSPSPSIVPSGVSFNLPPGASASEIGLYSFRIFPAPDHLKKQGLKQRGIFLQRKAADGWDVIIFSDRLADYLEYLPEKEVKVITFLDREKNLQVLRIGEINLSGLAAGEVQGQSAVKRAPVSGPESLPSAGDRGSAP